MDWYRLAMPAGWPWPCAGGTSSSSSGPIRRRYPPPRGDTAAEHWVRDRALAVLEGKAREVAAGIRRRATTAGLAKPRRKKADECARYLVNKAPYLDYPAALAAGWPVATA